MGTELVLTEKELFEDDQNWEKFVREELFLTKENCEKIDENHTKDNCYPAQLAKQILKFYKKNKSNKELLSNKFRYKLLAEGIEKVFEILENYRDDKEVYEQLKEFLHDGRYVLDHVGLTNEDWLKIRSAKEIPVKNPERDLLDFLIGQDEVKKIMELIAEGGKMRNVEMIGVPGTGKSLAGKGLAQRLGQITPIKRYKYNFYVAKKMLFLEVQRKDRLYEKISGAPLHIFYENYIMPKLLNILPRGVCDALAFYNYDNPARPFVRILPPGWAIKFEDESKARESFSDDVKNFSIDYTFVNFYGIAATYLLSQILLGATPITMLTIVGALGSLLFVHIFLKFGWYARTLLGGGTKGLEVRKRTPVTIVNNEACRVPFVYVDEPTTTQLFGYTQHDPFGGMGRLEHESLIAGKIHEANGGVLYIDEAEIFFNPKLTDYGSLVNNLKTAMEDGKYGISHHQTSTTGGTMAHVSTFNKLPTRFMMIVAGNKPIEDEALRNRFFARGYSVYVNNYMQDSPLSRRAVLAFIHQWMKIEKFERSEEYLDANRGAMKEVLEIARKLSTKAGSLTTAFRTLGGYIRYAEDLARSEGSSLIEYDHIKRAWRDHIPLELQEIKRFLDIMREYKVVRNSGYLVGVVNGVAVYSSRGGYVNIGIGDVQPIEASVSAVSKESKVSSPSESDTSFKESLENVLFLFEKITNKYSYRARVNFVQTYGNIAGDSASIAILAALLSSYANIPVDQSIAVTGSVSLNGDILPVGGIVAKIDAAKRCGLKKIIIPYSNKKDVPYQGDDSIEILYGKDLKDYLINSGLLKFDEKNELHNEIKIKIENISKKEYVA